VNNKLCSDGSEVIPRAIDWTDAVAYDDLKAGCRLGTLFWWTSVL
jgi:hypothetical protein